MKISIIGGGTAGWLAALMIKKIQPDHDITVVESSKIPIVGAGEGSTGYLTDIVQNRSWNFGCNERDFLLETGATIKLGIKHKDWTQVGHTYYGPIDAPATAFNGIDHLFFYALANDIPAHRTSRNGELINHNSSSFFHKDFDAQGSDTYSHAYHFDAHRVGQYFKKVVSQDGVVVVDAEVLDTMVSDAGISGLRLSNGTTLTSDLYIDCTGFARKLATALDIKWNSYQKHLPVNSAMPFILPIEQDDIVEPVTTAWAQSAGWMWQIPVDQRYGCGYVFDDRFTTPDQAQQEIEQALGRTIDPIRILKFDTGRLDKLWHKNCLVLGLAAAFAEPLEATSIHSTIVQLTAFIYDYLRETPDSINNPGSQNIYNRRMTKMYDDFKDFLVLHYQTKRTDSEFWRWMQTGECLTDEVKNILDLVNNKIPQPSDFDRFYGYAGAGLWNWVLAGLEKIGKEHAARDMKFWSVNEADTKLIFDWHVSGIAQEVKHQINNNEFVRNKQRYL